MPKVRPIFVCGVHVEEDDGMPVTAQGVEITFDYQTLVEILQWVGRFKRLGEAAYSLTVAPPASLKTRWLSTTLTEGDDAKEVACGCSCAWRSRPSPKHRTANTPASEVTMEITADYVRWRGYFGRDDTAYVTQGIEAEDLFDLTCDLADGDAAPFATTGDRP